MKRSAKFPLFHRIKTLFNRIFHSSEKLPHEALSFPEIDTNTMAWGKADTMVGTVRTWEQLSYNLSHKCYYVPARLLTAENFPIKYIALQERDSQEIPCITRVGEVISVVSLPRKTIPVAMRSVTDPKEQYSFFTVKDWDALPHRIEIRDTPWGKPLFTHRFLLDRCRESWELFVLSSSEDHSLLKALHFILKSKRKKNISCPVSPSRILHRKKDILILTNDRKTALGMFSLKEYKAAPRSAFLRIKEFL